MHEACWNTREAVAGNFSLMTVERFWKPFCWTLAFDNGRNLSGHYKRQKPETKLMQVVFKRDTIQNNSDDLERLFSKTKHLKNA